jgi:hypothetical protein
VVAEYIRRLLLTHAPTPVADADVDLNRPAVAAGLNGGGGMATPPYRHPSACGRTIDFGTRPVAGGSAARSLPRYLACGKRSGPYARNGRKRRSLRKAPLVDGAHFETPAAEPTFIDAPVAGAEQGPVRPRSIRR